MFVHFSLLVWCFPIVFSANIIPLGPLHGPKICLGTPPLLPHPLFLSTTPPKENMEHKEKNATQNDEPFLRRA